MTRIEIVKAAIEHLNKVKHTNLVILSCYLAIDHKTVMVKVAYPKPIPGWDPNGRNYNFSDAWFEDDPFNEADVERRYLKGFKCPDSIRKDQEKLSILWIAYWFYQNGKKNNAF